MKNMIYLIILLFSACLNQEPGFKSFTEEERWEQHRLNTEIIRDNFGVPHIYGKTDADAVFGLMYAQCEDDFFRVERNYIWAIGRLAEVEGESELYSDLRARLYMTVEEAMEKFEESPEWLQELCYAFADGMNFYLHEHPEVKPRLLTRFEPWMPFYFSEGSIGGDIERVSTRKIRDFYRDHSESLASYAPVESADREPRGSNGIAVSGKLTRSGNTMLLINPHTTFYFRAEVHMVSEEGLNVYGAVTWGQFFVYQGFNEKTAWMHTSTGTDVLDEFIETVEIRDGGKVYKYGDEYRPVDSMNVVLKYKTGEGTREKNFTMYRTHHGPVTHKENGKLVATSIMWDPVNALVQSYSRTKTSNHAGFDKVMDIRTNSSNNTVFADADGNIAYYHGNFIPVRDTSFDYTAPVDGSNPATDWNGLHPLDECIFVLNPENGWIQNCNSTPFTCCGPYSPVREDYPEYMTSYSENFRGIHAISLLENARDLTLDKMITLAYDPYLPGAEILVEGILEAFDGKEIQDDYVKAAVRELKDWDYNTSESSTAMTLCQYYYREYIRSGKLPRSARTRNGYIYYISTETGFDERIEIFTGSLKRLKEEFGSYSVEWGEVNRFQRLSGDIEQQFNDNLPSTPVGLSSGTWGALASFGTTRLPGNRRNYGVSGNSFVAVVEFGEKLKAKTVLVGGQSGDPDSRHFDDQVRMYIDGKFKDVPFYYEDVKERAESNYHPGEEMNKN